MGSSPAKRTISPGNGAISSVGESACLTSKRSLVRVQYRPPGRTRPSRYSIYTPKTLLLNRERAEMGLQMSKLYWTKGPAYVSVYWASPPSKDIALEVIRILEEFRSQCQRLWFAFDGMMNGRPLAVQRFKEMNGKRDNRLSVGNQFPDQEQSIGNSTIAQIKFGELVDAMAEGGEFEQLNAKAYLVFIDAIWEDSVRTRIAQILEVEERDVKCDLLADLRRLRNLVLHRSEKAKQDYLEKATLLPQIWDVNPDDVVITTSMLHALVEQLNAVQIHVGKAT